MSGALTDAADDAARLNMTPREWLDAVVLHADGREVICEPHLNGEAAMRIVNSVGGERVTAAINGEPIELHAVAGGLNLGDKAAGSFACTREQMEALQAGAQIEVVVTAPALKSAPGSGSFAARGVALPPFSSRKRAPLAAALNEEDA